MILNDAKHIMINGSPAVRVITGGSVVYCRRPDNLNQIAYCEAKTAQGLTYLSTDRTCTTELTGTLSAANSCTIFNNPDPVNSYKLAIIDITGGMNTDYSVIIKYKSSGNTTLTGNSIYTIQTESGGARWIRIYPIVGKTYDHYKIKVAIVNLTDMYGAGNEPETITDIKFQDLVYYLKYNWGYYLPWDSTWNNMVAPLGERFSGGNQTCWKFRSSTAVSGTFEDGIVNVRVISTSSTRAVLFGVATISILSSQINHKIYCTFKVKCTKNEDWYFTIGTNNKHTYIDSSISTFDEWTTYSFIINNSVAGSTSFVIARDNSSVAWEVGDEYSIKDICVVDLTSKYGTGNEPSSLSDDKISYINKYYISDGYYSRPAFLNLCNSVLTNTIGSVSGDIIHIDGVQSNEEPEATVQYGFSTNSYFPLYLPKFKTIRLKFYCRCENNIVPQNLDDSYLAFYKNNSFSNFIYPINTLTEISSSWTLVTLEFKTNYSEYYMLRIESINKKLYGIGSYIEFKDFSITIADNDDTLDSFVLDGGVLA